MFLPSNSGITVSDILLCLSLNIFPIFLKCVLLASISGVRVCTANFKYVDFPFNLGLAISV